MGDVLSFGALRAAASEIFNRLNFARAHGQTFEGNRDLYAAFGYKKDLTIEDYRSRYERGDIAARIIEAKPDDTWRGGAELIEIEDPEKITTFEQAFIDLDERLNIWSHFHRADILAGIGEYSVILLGTVGKLEDELPKTLKPENLLFLQPLTQANMAIKEEDLESDPENVRFGWPKFYTLTNVNGIKQDRKVHWTRVIHVADNVLESLLYGQPKLKRIWNRLDDLDKVAGGGSEAFFNRANGGIVFNKDPDVKWPTTEPAKSAAEKAMADELDEYQHGMRRFLRLQGVDATRLGSDVADFKSPVAGIIELISAATGIPQRILMGSERGELASSQDATNWGERIKNRRTQFAFPYVIKQFVERCITHGILPKPAKYEVRWPELMSLDMGQKSDIAVKISKVNQQQGEIVVTTDEIRDRVFGFDPLEKVDKELADKQKETRLADPPEEDDTLEEDTEDKDLDNPDEDEEVVPPPAA
jgi:hypothetical protein